jgi:hypothetical protein
MTGVLGKKHYFLKMFKTGQIEAIRNSGMDQIHPMAFFTGF